MMEDYVTRVLREGLAFGEGPRWHEERLWYSDFFRHGVYSVDERGDDERLEHVVPGQPSGLGWTTNGDLLCVSMTDHRVLRFHEGAETLFADVSPYCGFWANDMVVSSSDVSYVGNFGFDLDVMLRDVGVEGMLASPPPTTNLVVLSPTGDVLQVVPDLAFPNGTVITPDGKTLIVGETMTFRLTAFDVNTNGTLTNRRVWAQLDFVTTDGMCLDAEGQIWLANSLTNQCLRVREGGEVTGVVETTQRAFACALGGTNRSTLFVMTAPTNDRFKVAGTTPGLIEVVDVPVPGAGLP
ncbi:MAG TPA: SMP-30/gluconolactonase/LRE family protein [Acidimicrobiales bacterium]|nr:SMP-30/gluconolactonase/LRE family protein [Acidimicrobiales bacterium]